MRKFTALIISAVILLTSCAGEISTSSEGAAAVSTAEQTTSEEPQQTSAEELAHTEEISSDDNRVPLGSIIDGGCTLEVIRRGAAQFDFLLRTEEGDKTVHSVELSASVGEVQCTVYSEDDVAALVLYQPIIGSSMPANVLTLADGEVAIHSTYSDSTEGSPELFYCPYGGIICRRGNGVSAGSANCIPYYYDGEEGKFAPYALAEITKDELRALDTARIVPDIDGAISVYRRENGLIHVNYLEIYTAYMGSPDIASRTFVETESGLRQYDFESDMRYGLLLEALTVTE